MSEGETASETGVRVYGGSPLYSVDWFDDRGHLNNFDLSCDGFSGIYLADVNDRALRTRIGIFDFGCQFHNEWNVSWRSTDASFDRGINAIRNDPHDPRWGCAEWNDHVDCVAEALRESYASDFDLDDSPIAMLKRYESKRVYIAWRSETGGGAIFCADFGSHDFTCRDCAACKSHDRFHIEKTGRRQGWEPARSVYFVQGVTGGPIKIGHSASPSDRLPSLQTGNPSLLRIVATMRGGVAVERTLHRAFANDRVHGEWFSPSRELVAFIDEISRKGCTQ